MIDSQLDKDVKYSVIKYGNTANVYLPFKDANSISRVKDMINILQWEKSDGLAVGDVIRKTVQSFEQSGRPGAQRVLVLFASGRAALDEGRSGDLKKALAEAGVNTVVIAISLDDEEKIKEIIPGEKAIITMDPNEDTRDSVPDVIKHIMQGRILWYSLNLNMSW